jgi:hypothetical protein
MITRPASASQALRLQLGRHPLAQRPEAFAGGVLQRLARGVGEHLLAGLAQRLHRKPIGRGQPARQADDAGPLGELEQLADGARVESLGPAGQGPGNAHRGFSRIQATAAWACSTVVSNTGSGLDCVVDQQADLGAAQDHGLGAALGQPADQRGHGLARFVAQHAAAQLVEDHRVHQRPVGFFGYQQRRAVAPEAVDDDVGRLHREARAQEAGAAHASLLQGQPGGVGNVQQWQAGPRGHCVAHAVHGVGGDQQRLGAGGPQARCGLGQQRRGSVPVVAALAGGHLFEVQAGQRSGALCRPPAAAATPWLMRR